MLYSTRARQRDDPAAHGACFMRSLRIALPLVLLLALAAAGCGGGGGSTKGPGDAVAIVHRDSGSKASYYAPNAPPKRGYTPQQPAVPKAGTPPIPQSQ